MSSIQRATPRKGVFKALFVKFFLGCFVAATTFSILVLVYVGGLWDPQEKIYKLGVGFLNDDEGFMRSDGVVVNFGDDIWNTFSKAKSVSNKTSNEQIFKWKILPKEYYTYDIAVDEMVNDLNFWGVIYIPKNFSRTLYQLIYPDYSNSNASTTNAIVFNNTITYVYDQGKLSATVSLVSSYIPSLVNGATKYISSKIFTGYYGNHYNTSIRMSNVNFNALSNPVQSKNVVVHPVRYYGLNLATIVSLSALFVASFMTVSIINSNLGTIELYYHTRGLLVIRIGILVIVSLLTSMIIMLVLVTYGTPFNGGNWFGFWMFYWLGALSMMFFTGFVFTVFGPLGLSIAAILLFFMLVGSNTQQSQELMNPIFYINWGFPLLYVAEGFKSIVFGSVNKMKRDIGILFLFLVFYGSIEVILLKKRFDQKVAERKLLNETQSKNKVLTVAEMEEKLNEQHEEEENNDKMNRPIQRSQYTVDGDVFENMSHTATMIALPNIENIDRTLNMTMRESIDSLAVDDVLDILHTHKLEE